MEKIDYLITTVKKTHEEIKDIIKKLNIIGNILVGNQGVEQNEIIVDNMFGCTVTIINSNDLGVSKNRNRLLKYSSSEFVTFLDDDMYYPKKSQSNIEKMVFDNRQYNCIRFNVTSDNADRPIKLLKTQGKVGFRKLSSFGVWGIFYRRSFLLENSLFFNEKIGPGTDINHGEDTLFIKECLKKTKIYCIPTVAFHVTQLLSTWHSNQRDLKKELISHGYNYYLLYGKKAQFMSILFLLTHMKCYPKKTSFFLLRSYMKIGIKKAMEDSL